MRLTTKGLLISAFLALYTTDIFAEEVTEAERPPFSWQAMLGFSAIGNNSILQGDDDDLDVELSLLIDLYYRGFFINSGSRRFDVHNTGTELGYRIIEQQDYELDVLVKSYMLGFNEYGHDVSSNDNDDFVESLRGINRRDYDSTYSLRYTRFYGDSIFWIDVGGDLLGQNYKGWLIDSYYSYQIPVRNWDIYLGVGVSLYSSELVDYYWSVGADEVAENRPEYSAGSGGRIQFEAMAQFPIAENWLGRGGISQTFYSSSIRNSPLVESSPKPQLSIEVRYVF